MNYFYLALAAATLAACTNDVDYGSSDQGGTSNTIGFQVLGRNSITRATSLQKAGHYNFGVFAYKSSDNVNNIMDNYLVGYMDAANNKGYYFTDENQTTNGDKDGELNGKSRWAYEMLGNEEYDYEGTEGYYTKKDNFYMSNVDKQYLRYWDKSAPFTNFYAYAPYVYDATESNQVKYANNNQTMTFPAKSIKAGYDDPSRFEYMYAAEQVSNANYGHDVSLNFKRLNAKVQIKFWEDIDGYSVRILDLKKDTYTGVYAAPSKRSGSASPYTYEKGKYVKTTGATIDFSSSTSATEANPKPIADIPAVTFNSPESYSQTDAAEMLRFDAPAVEAIGTTRPLASPSRTVYYAIPKSSTTGSDYDCGFTFHVTYELISSTGERIKVNDATVHVPSDVCNWVSNTSYTYIFRITKNSNGTTDTPTTIDPTSPDVTTEDALYPIVFDNCIVEDYKENNSDWTITDETNVTLYSVVLTNTSINNKAQGTVNVALKKKDGTAVSIPAGTWSVTTENGGTTTLTVDNSNGTITVPASTSAGIYTVTYTLSASEKTKYPNQPETYSAQFEVVQDFGMTLSTSEIGTGGMAATKFTITTTDKFGGTTPKLSDLTIVYPDGLTADQKSKVNIISVANPTTISVAKDAATGTYKIKYGDGSNAEYAEKTFEVKDFGFSMARTVVELTQSDQIVNVYGTLTTPTSGTATFAVTPESAGVTIDNSTGAVTVTPSATAQVYTIKRTVTCSTSVTEYVRTIEVKNVYTLSLSKTVVDNDVDTEVQVTATKNGADANSSVEVSGSLSYENSTGKITISNTTPAGTYTVSLKDGSVVVKTVELIVQN